MINKKSIAIFFSIAVVCFTPCYGGEKQIDERLVGVWQGMREQNGKCKFLSWITNLKADSNFEITFYFDKDKTKKIQVERGYWTASNGQAELKTDGVEHAEIYVYKIIDVNTIAYTNIKRDPSADCQDDYQFIEVRLN